MAHLQDSSDDEIGVNLQLAERLTINRGVHAPFNGKHMNRKASKQLYNQRKKKHFEDQSSSSSLELHNDASTSEPGVCSLHNKKRQNRDKGAEQFANPKRTCFGGGFEEASDCRKKALNKDIPHSSKMVNLPSSDAPCLRRKNLFPDKTYEDHLNLSDDDSDFEPRRRFNRHNVLRDLDEDIAFMNGSLSTAARSKSCRNRSTINHGFQFESASDEDSRTLLQNGALKGGRQSPTHIRKKLLGHDLKKMIDGENRDDWSGVYRSRPLILSSSDSEDSTLSSQVNGKAAGVSKNSANPSFTSGDSSKPACDPGYLKPRDLHSFVYSDGPLYPISSSAQILSQYRSNSPVDTSNQMGSFDRVDVPSNNIRSGAFAGIDDSHSLRPHQEHSRMLRSHQHIDSIPKSPRGRPLAAVDSSHGRSCKSVVPPDLLDVDLRDMHYLPSSSSSSCSSMSWNGSRVHSSVNAAEDCSRGPVVPFSHNSRGHRRVNPMRSVRYNTCPKFEESNLATAFPDLFDAEDSSDVEFFTANSYSDTESTNNDSRNRRIRAAHRSQPVRGPETLCDSSINVSSEDEISVVFTSGPNPRDTPQRRGTSRPLGRRYTRGNRSRLESVAREVVSLSPDPVEQVRRMEADERFARMLQAQFDAENVPPYVPCNHSPDPHQMNARESSSTDDNDDESDVSEHDLLVNWRSMIPQISMPLERYRMTLNSGSGSSTLRDTIHEFARLMDIPFHSSFNLIPIDAPDDSYEAFLSLADLNGDVAQGLQRAQINRLPTRKYVAPGSSAASAKQPAHKRAELNKECQVCLSDYVNGDVLRILPCFHEFHTPCIDPWLKINHTCPVCRVRVEL